MRRRLVAVRPRQRHLEQRRAPRVLLPRGAQRLDERRIEDLAERPADRIGALDAVEALERVIPADDALVLVEHDQPVVERLEDVLVELAHPAELLGLEVELPVQPAVLDRGRDLAGDRRQQREILAVERLVGVLPAERQHGDRRAFEDAGHEVVDALIAPELDFLGGEPRGGNRIVERDGVAAVQPRHERRRRACRRGTGWAKPKSPMVRKSPSRSSASISAMRSTTSVSTMRVTSRWLSRTTSRSLFRSRANPTSARR